MNSVFNEDMDIGEISVPVKTSRGYAIARLELIDPEGISLLEDVRPDIVAKVKKEQQDIVSLFIPRGTDRFERPVKIIFNWYEPNRKRDIDNISFAKKFILDALVAHHILLDDSQKYVIKLEDNVFVDRRNPRIEVSITEL